MALQPNASKYTPPKLPAVVPRSRLTQRLQTDSGQHLVLILGQAAQGKSTLAAHYLAVQSGLPAWLHLGKADADSIRFFYLLIHALARATDASLLEHLAQVRIDAGNPVTLLRLEELLATVWQRLPGNIQIVLDGLEQLPRNAPAHRLIECMISLAAGKGRLMILSRQPPPYKLQQWVMRRQVVTIDNDELAFSAQEIQAYFKLLYGYDLPAPCADGILNVTGGWVGGLVLIGQTLNRKPRDQWADFLTHQLPTGLSGAALEFFSEEIFEPEPRELQTFLIQTAVMDVIDPQILAKLFPDENTAAILDDLVQRNLFIQPISDARPHPLYRLNPLFRDFLRSKFQTRIITADQVKLYERIAGIYLERRQAEIAVGFFLKANNFTAAARSIKKAGTDLVIRGHFDDLENALAALPAERVKADPWLLLLLTLTRRVKGGLRNIDDFQSALAAFRDQNDLRGQLFALAYIIEAQVFTGHDPHACQTWITRGEALLAAHNDRPYFTFARTLLWLQMGLAYIASGLDLTKGISAARSAYLLAYKIKDPRLMANANIVAALGLASAGDFEQADQALEKIAALADTDAYTEYHTLRSLVNVALALHRGDLKSARTQLKPIAEEIETFGLLFLYPAYVDATGLLQIYLGEYDAARSTCRHLLDVAVLSGNPYYEGLSHRMSALRHYFQQRYFDAAAAAENALAMLPRDEQPTLHWMRTQQLTGLIEYHLSKYEQAQRRLLEARQYFSKTGNFLSLSETCLSLALVAAKLSLEPSMQRYLREGFSLAAERQYDHFVILCPTDLERCCRLALDHLDKAAGAWPEHLLAAKFPTPLSGPLISRREIEWPEDRTAGENWNPEQPFLEIQTLGAFRVMRNGHTFIQDKHWGGRRTKLLLKAILVHGLQDIPKDILIEDLWPESDPDASLLNFKVTLHRLRKILEPELGKHSRSSYIHLKDNLISLDRNRCRVDVQVFLQCCKDIKRAALAKENQTILELGRQAMALYQGDFLPEDPYAPWADMKRLALKDEYITAIMMMADIYRAQDQWEEAAQCCRAAIAADPCLEQAGAMLMDLLTRQERRNDAAKVYEQLRAALENDLGVEPDPGITAIYRRLREESAKNWGAG